MKLKLLPLLIGSLLASCGEDQPLRPANAPAWSIPLKIDGTKLYVPASWSQGRPWDARPWDNGVKVGGTGGWRHFTPWLGPLEGANPLPEGAFYVSDSQAQRKRKGNPDVFFKLTALFEFPQPPRRSWWRQNERHPGFAIDRLDIIYRAADDRAELPYLNLLAGLVPSDGEDVGDGWREVRRQFDDREIALRFDQTDWLEHGGPLPRRLAASFSPNFWSHYMPLNAVHWEAHFKSQNLPISQWRSRYETAEELFSWLRTPVEARDHTKRFAWWANFDSRPPR